MGRKRIKPKVETIPGYTEKQSKFLRGEITVDDIDGKFVHWFLKRAIKANDTELISTLESLRDYFKEETENRRKRKSQAVIKGEEIPVKKANRNYYNPKEKKIIEGVMNSSINPKEVHGNTILTIASIACAIDDEDVYNTFYALYNERKRKSAERFFTMKAKNYDASGDSPNDYGDRKYLTSWEKRVLECDIDLDLCPLEHLEHIFEVTKETNDERYYPVAELMLEHKKNPLSVITEEDKENSSAILDKLFNL